MKPPRMGLVSSDRVKSPVPVICAAALLTTLPRKAPTLESVMASGSSGATCFTRASLAAITTALPIRVRSLGEKISCSRPVEDACTARRASSWMYCSSGSEHISSRAWRNASSSTSCLAARDIFRPSI